MAINKRKILEAAQKHLHKGALDKALKEYQKLLKADPKDVNVRLKVGDVHLKQGKTEEAIAAYLRVAETFMKDGFDAKAVALFKQISKIDPKRFDIYLPLSELYQRMGLNSDAMKALQTAADASYQAGEKDEALDLLRKMAALDPANTTNRVKVAELLHQGGRSAEALAEYEEVASELARQGDEEERVRILERILEFDPDRVAARVEVGRARLQARRWELAEAEGRTLVETHSEETDGYEILGEALEAAGKTEESAKAYRKLADLYRERGDEDKARDIMQRFGMGPSLGSTDEPVLETDDELSFDPDASCGDLGLETPEFTDPGFSSESGLELGAPIEGLTDTETVPAADPAGQSSSDLPPLHEPETDDASTPEGDPEQLLAEANVYLRYGKHDRAIDSLRAVLLQEPDRLEALEKLADALVQGERGEEAVEPLRHAGELARRGEDTEALARIRERLEPLDPAAAEQLTVSATPLEPAESAVEVALDADLDEEVTEEPTETASNDPSSDPDAIEGIEFDIDLDSADGDAEAAMDGEEAGQELSLTREDPGLEVEMGGGEEVEERAGSDPGQRGSEGVEEATPGGSATTPAQVQEDLEEAEFYFQQGMMAEAREIYEQILALAPNHPQAQLRLGEIAEAPEPSEPAPTLVDADLPELEGAEAPALERTAPEEADPGLVEESEEPVSGDDFVEAPFDPQSADLEPEPGQSPFQAEITAPDLGAEPEGEDSGSFDLAAELSDAFDEEEELASSSSGLSGTTEEEGFQQVFAAFKEGVKSELDDGDFEAHFDLGIAYKEMGLHDDAISEFQRAMGEEERRLVCLHMMGLCALDLGRAADATAHMEQALALPELPEEQQLGVRFDLGRAYAAAGDRERARAAFEAVRSVDPTFCDVAQHLADLDQGDSPSPEEADGDEAFESFDDLLEEVGGAAPDDAESPAAAAEPVGAYESFDDLVDADEEVIEAGEVEAVPVAEVAPTPDVGAGKGRKRRGGRKKISFV